MSREVIVVGGGWAGISAACWLSSYGFKVTLLEAAPQLGGRARSVDFGSHRVDNGQHLFVSGYHHVFDLLKLIGQNPKDVFEKHPFTWHLLGETSFEMRFLNLKAPFHALGGILFAKGLSLTEKWQLICFSRHLLTTSLLPSVSVKEYIQKFQSPKLIKMLWEPMCVAALSTPIEKASLDVFRRVLLDAFQKKAFSDLCFAKKDLSALLPIPAEVYLEKLGAKVFTRQRVKSLWMKEGRCLGVQTQDKNFMGEVVLALPFAALPPLLSSIPEAQSLLKNVQSFHHEPITTVYLQYAVKTKLPFPMIGLEGRLGHWVFDRAFADQPGLMAVVITGEGKHLHMPHDELALIIAKELETTWPWLKKPKDTRVIHEKRAAFSCQVHTNPLRPSYLTNIPGLSLAGDYCQTPYPATLEGAVMSGKLCADQLRELKNEPPKEVLCA